MAQTEGLLRSARTGYWIFAAALTVRVIYLLWVYDDVGSLSHADSAMWLELAQNSTTWFGTHDRMPAYPLFLHAHFLVFGAQAPIAAVVSQMAIDAAACVGIARLADAIRPGAGLWAGTFAVLNPTQIVMAALLLGDSLFMALLTGGLLAMANWWRTGSSDRLLSAFAIGVWFGLGLLNRAMIWPFVPVLGLALFAICWRMGTSPTRALRVPAAALAVIGLCATPIMIKNWETYNVAALSSQGGMHFGLWVYPLVKEASDGTPYETTVEEVRRTFIARGGQGNTQTPFEQSAIYGQIVREGLADVGFAGIAKAWALGAAVNLASPATLMIPPVMALPRTGFYATQGNTPLEKVANFLMQSSSLAYLGWLAGGIAVEWPVRLLSVFGLFLTLSRRATLAPGIFAALWIGFVLTIHGPIASPKYRLPIEPIAMAMAGFAAAVIRRQRASYTYSTKKEKNCL
jgi:hypothetical protein